MTQFDAVEEMTSPPPSPRKPSAKGVYHSQTDSYPYCHELLCRTLSEQSCGECKQFFCKECLTSHVCLALSIPPGYLDRKIVPVVTKRDRLCPCNEIHSSGPALPFSQCCERFLADDSKILVPQAEPVSSFIAEDRKLAVECASDATWWDPHDLLYCQLNGRLAALLSPIPPQIGALRMAHYITHFCSNSFVYGGFIRDYVFHGLPAHDLDITVIDKASLQPTLDLLVEWGKSQRFLLVKSEPKGSNVLRGYFRVSAYCEFDDCAKFKPCDVHPTTCEEWVVELVDIHFWDTKRPLVDCDMNNYLLVPTGLVHKRPGQGGPLRLLASRTRQKEFFAFDVGSSQRDRIQRFKDQGWVCMNPERLE